MAKRKVLLIYGEKTTQINFRVPGSKKEKIIKEVDELLKKYHDPKHVSIDVKDSVFKKNEIEIPDEVGQFIGHKDKSEILPKKIEPQVVVEKEKQTNYLVVDSIPFSSEIFINFGKGKAIRKDGNDYYTKETKEGKLLLLKHASKEDAILYTEINFH